MPEPDSIASSNVDDPLLHTYKMVNNGLNVFWDDVNDTQVMVLAKDEYAGVDPSQFIKVVPRYQIYVDITVHRVGGQ